MYLCILAEHQALPRHQRLRLQARATAADLQEECGDYEKATTTIKGLRDLRSVAKVFNNYSRWDGKAISALCLCPAHLPLPHSLC